jgi:translocator protein
MGNLFKLIVSIVITLAAGGVGSYFTTPAIATWYASLHKPFFNPPNFVFAPVWTILYILMGISFYLIWEKNQDKNKKGKALAVEYYFAQLFVNIFWSVVFFGLHSPLAGLITIAILWFLIFKTIKAFQKINKTAAYLLYPYIAWVSFAAILNFAVWILNR